MEGGDSWGTARAEDPGLSAAREAAEAVPPGKRPPGAISLIMKLNQKKHAPRGVHAFLFIL
ncbi:hypothetical protein BCM40_15075 [Planococcus donghaensis]|uniref:Uncharacterized protein n=1 Tax=Planococcus donghaensis TaxID=414778 RepID=A0A1C7EKT4_9BACL|nr:hypothetical protein BCM40_15075 [Planococcus donghaensis]